MMGQEGLFAYVALICPGIEGPRSLGADTYVCGVYRQIFTELGLFGARHPAS